MAAELLLILPASHLPELFLECGNWVRKGEGDGGAGNRAGKLPAVSGGCAATYPACATPEQLVLLGAHCLDIHPAPTSSHLPASGLRARVLRVQTKELHASQ